jgi:predicted acetyltransferase
MTIEVRIMRAGEIPRLREVLSTAFGGGDPESDWDIVWEKVFEHDRIMVATEGDEIVGAGGSFSFTMTVPGAEIPAAGLTIVGVLPTHRRKGILTKLMRFHFEDARSHGEPVSILWASEEVIYQRYGYGMASEQLGIDMHRGQGEFRNDTGPAGRLRLLTEEEALKVFPDVYDKVRRETPGMLVRDPDWWKYHRLYDPKSSRGGSSPYYRLVWENDGQVEAYAVYRVKESWDDATGLPKGEVTVAETMSTTPQSHRELWRYLFSLDLTGKVVAYFNSIDDPIQQMVMKPRHLRLRKNDGIWLRVVDVKPALESRLYGTEGTLTFELTDTFLEDNQGTWKLTVSGGHPEVVSTTDPADLRMDAGDLGAVYLGGMTFNQLHRAGRVVEVVGGAVERADSMFHSNRAPWNPELW